MEVGKGQQAQARRRAFSQNVFWKATAQHQATRSHAPCSSSSTHSAQVRRRGEASYAMAMDECCPGLLSSNPNLSSAQNSQ
jgi:hypothetical protein